MRGSGTDTGRPSYLFLNWHEHFPFLVLVVVKQIDLPDYIVLWILKNLAVAR